MQPRGCGRGRGRGRAVRGRACSHVGVRVTSWAFEMSSGEGPMGCTSRHEVPGENFSMSGCTLALECM